MIDIGANLTHEHFRHDVPQVLAEAKAAGLEHIIATGADIDSAEEARALAEAHAGLSFTAGIHPHQAGALDAPQQAALQRLWAHPRCVAVGEAGLDYKRMHQPKPAQRDCLVAQLALSRDLALPLFLHNREADADFIDILDREARGRSMVVHCYTGGSATLRRLLDRGAMIGITGWLCDERRNHDLRAALDYLPIESTMIESDAPWLLPRSIEGFRRIRHNHPKLLGHVLAALARAKRMDIEDCAARLRANSIEFFGLRDFLG